MKAVLEIPEKKIKHELENITFDTFLKVGKKPNAENPNIIERYPVGFPIKLITENMPTVLKDEIVSLIEKYCNH